MSPVPTDLCLTGHRIKALLRAYEAVILTLQQPVDILRNGMSAEAIAELRQVEDETPPLHVAFFPALTVNMMVRTHEGPLPEAVQALAVDLMPPEVFAVLRGRAITSLGKPLDGSRGIALEIEGGYLLQIDLTGAAVYQRETPDAQRS